MSVSDKNEAIVKTVHVDENHRVHIELELPDDMPVGEAIATITIKSKVPVKNRMAELRGVLKGQIWMSEDFDEPLDDFKDYM